MIIDYNRNAAIAYALRWALKRNPDYYNYTGIGGDCTNFVSQCVYAGSGVMNYEPVFGWYYINANDKSPSWTGVQYFYDFMIGNTEIGPFAEERALNELIPGDVIQLGNEDGNFYHSLLLTAILRGPGGRRYYVCAHSDDALNRRLSTYDFTVLRGIHILGVRTED